MSTVRLFHDFQKIFGFCPCCGEPFRLSEATLFHRAPPPRTSWDVLEEEREKLARAEERLFEDEERLREKAQKEGRKEMERRLRSLTSFLRRQRIAVRDVKLLFHPVDYVAFRGFSDGSCSAVEFIDREPVSSAHEELQRSIEQSIRAGNFEWITLRIEGDGRVSIA